MDFNEGSVDRHKRHVCIGAFGGAFCAFFKEAAAFCGRDFFTADFAADGGGIFSVDFVREKFRRWTVSNADGD